MRTFAEQVAVLERLAALHGGHVVVAGEPGGHGHHAYLMLRRGNAIDAGHLAVALLPEALVGRLVLDVGPWDGEWFVTLKASPCPQRLGVAQQEVSP